MPQPARLKRFERLRGHVVCPHCWHRFPVSEVLWIAKHEDLRGDPILGGDEFVRFRASRFDVSGLALDARGIPCEGLACPRCHLVIPRVLLERQPLIFSIVGVPYSGKSYFLASMTWQLRSVLPGQFSVAFTDADPINNRMLNQYEETLFLSQESSAWVGLEKTQQTSNLYVQLRLEDQDVVLPQPFLFVLRPGTNHRLAKAAEQQGRVLCFYDNAGEHFLPGAEEARSPATQHLARSKVLMFLFDPTQVPAFRDRCRAFSQDPQVVGSWRVQRQEITLTEMGVRVRTHADLPPQQKLDQPLIVLVAKSDLWANLIDEDIDSDPYVAASDGGDEPGGVDFERIERVSGKVRRLLLELTPEFVAAAEDLSKQVLFIPVSALGSSPEQQEGHEMLVIRAEQIKPRWVTVPLVYAFGKWATGLVRAVS